MVGTPKTVSESQYTDCTVDRDLLRAIAEILHSMD
jgi:hypothetical protein